MADRSFHPNKGSLEIDIVDLYATLTFGSSGAVTLTDGKGISTATQVSAVDGQYKLKFSDSYNKLMWANMVLVSTTARNSASIGVSARIISEDVNHATDPHIIFTFYATDDGAFVDPADGDVALCRITLRNSSVE